MITLNITETEKEQLREIYNKLKVEAIDELNLCGLEWSDNFLTPWEFTPDFDYGEEDHSHFFAVTIGRMIMILDLLDE